jgi:2-polyprenyl-3-methyl-5-hydroxy-6-metoxy-1,4-benzoquinol methylase
MRNSTRAEHEIEHGRKLLEAGAEQTWGWGTAAGQIRARQRADWIIQHANLKPGMSVLEIGCGTGNFTEYFAQSGANIMALDISEDLIRRAKERNLTKNIQFICRPFEALEMSGEFDAIIGSSVLHHLEIKPALQEIYRLLKPDGVMAFAEPNMLNPQIMVQKNIPWIKRRVGDSPDETAFFRGQMQRLLKQVGFKQIDILPLDWLHPAIPPRAINFFLNIGKMLEKTPLLREFAGSLYISARRSLD